MGHEPPSAGGRESRFLGAVASLALARPKLTLLLALIAMVACAAVSWDMPVSTSRYKLVAADNPFQARLLRFFDRFGYPESLVVVVSGGDDQARRKAVDELSRRYEELPGLKDRVLGRLGATHVAELLLLFRPEALRELRSRFEGEPAELVEGGLPAWVNAVEGQLASQLDGESDAGEVKDADIDQGMRRFAAMLKALSAELAGADGAAEMPTFGESYEIPEGVAVDERGYVVTADGQHHLIALFPHLPGMEGSQVQPVVDEIRAVRDSVHLDGVTADITGLPAFVSDELRLVRRGLLETSGATFAGILILLLAAFRSVRYTLLSLIPLGVGVVLTLAMARGLFGGLNLVTSSFVPVLLALGIDFGVYVLSRYGEQVRAGEPVTVAIRHAITKTGPGLMMGAATTMAAFLMTTTIEFTAYSELGVITAVGLALMLAVTFLLLPGLILLAGRGKQLRSPELTGVRMVPKVVRKGRWAVLGIAGALVAVSTVGWLRLEFNARYFDFLPDHTETAKGLAVIEHDERLSPVQATASAEGVEEARLLATKLRALPSVASVQSATDLLPALDDAGLKALREGVAGMGREPDFDALRNRKRSTKELARAVAKLSDTVDEVAFTLRRSKRPTAGVTEVKDALSALRTRILGLGSDTTTMATTEQTVADLLERAWRTAKAVAERGHYLPSDLPEMFRNRFVSKDGKALAVFVNPAGNVWDAQTAETFATETAGVDPEISGLAVAVHEHIRMIKEGFTRASMYSAGLVLLFLLIGFRRLGDALLAILPVAVGVSWLVGLMGATGMSFNVANVVTLPLITGVGVDAGAHMMHRWRQSADAGGGVASIGEIIRGTGAAVLMASLTTATGFAALMLGEYGGMKTLGLTMTIGIGACMVASLLVLPAVLLVTGKAR